MKRTLVVLFVMVGCGFVAEPAPSQTPQEFPSTSGNAFVRLWSVVEKDLPTQEDFRNLMTCIGSVEGVVQGALYEVAYVEDMTGKSPPKPFCPPADVENGQFIRVTLKYIRNHPEKAHMQTVGLIFDALREAFPCKQ